MPTTQEHCLYKLDSAYGSNPQQLDSLSAQGFDRNEYSRFKYGDSEQANKYAQLLVNSMIESGLIHKDQEYFLCGSAYRNVPTAAIALALGAVDLLVSLGYRVTFFKVNCDAFKYDYSQLDFEKRQLLLANLAPSVEDSTARLIRNKRIIVIDDAKITGLHKQAVHDLLEMIGVSEITFSYIAAFVNTEFCKTPRIEWELNRSMVDSLKNLADIMLSDNFRMNSRVCKFVLAADKKELKTFLGLLPSETVDLLALSLESDMYHKMPSFKSQYETINKFRPKQPVQSSQSKA